MVGHVGIDWPRHDLEKIAVADDWQDATVGARFRAGRMDVVKSLPVLRIVLNSSNVWPPSGSPLSDGKVCWPEALWSDFCRSPQSSGNWHARHPDYDPLEDVIDRAARELLRPRAEAWYRAHMAGTDAASVVNRA